MAMATQFRHRSTITQFQHTATGTTTHPGIGTEAIGSAGMGGVRALLTGKDCRNLFGWRSA